MADHPLVGTGPDTFYAYYPFYRPASDGTTINARIGVDKPHNVLLEHASDAGVPALAAYLAVVGLALLYGYRRCRRATGAERALGAAFLGLLSAYLAQAVVSIDQPTLALTGWIAVGGVVALADPGVIRSREALAVPYAEQQVRRRATGGTRGGGPLPAGSAIWRRAALALALPVAGATVLVGLAPPRADLAGQDRRFDEAIRLDPSNTDARLAAASRAQVAGSANPDADERRRLLERARRLCLDSLRLKPRDTKALVGLALVEQTWASGLDPAHFREAETWWRRALALDPRNQLLAQSYAQSLPDAVRSTVVRTAN
ncbi:MAG: O-antigen ligase family protein [Acidimicrobiales bacterium]